MLSLNEPLNLDSEAELSEEELSDFVSYYYHLYRFIFPFPALPWLFIYYLFEFLFRHRGWVAHMLLLLENH